jgi:microcystin-dependent protein
MDPYVGEIRLFAGKYAPVGWAFCNGEQLAIQSNQALFAVIGTTYGGDGKNFFRLPDMRGCVPMHFGNGNGLTPRVLGEKGGEAAVTLSTSQIPAHAHDAGCQSTADKSNPEEMIWANSPGGKASVRAYSDTGTEKMAAQAIAAAGGGKPHNNMQPYVAINFIIALEGVFPPKA